MVPIRSLALCALVTLVALGCSTTGSWKFNADPMVCATIGAVLGGVGGGTWAADNSGGDDSSEAGYGAAGGAAAGAALGWLLCEKETTAAPERRPSPPPRAAPEPPQAERARPKRRIVLRGVNFDFDSAAIRDEAAVVLTTAVEVLEESPDAQIEVAGHTDSTGPEAYNQGLSERRARAVVDYLERKGIKASRLRVAGHGESQPVADNGTRDGRAQNRRVELLPLQ